MTGGLWVWFERLRPFLGRTFRLPALRLPLPRVTRPRLDFANQNFRINIQGV